MFYVGPVSIQNSISLDWGTFLKNSGVSIPSMRMILLRPFWPLTMIICDEAIFNCFAKSLTHILFAAPSTGGDVRRIFKDSPRRPQILFFEDRG